jgi:AcrR family transcriptional regulator
MTAQDKIDASTKKPPGRPRSEATQQAIIDATIGLLDKVDYRDISIDRIAATAQVGKQSIYRWWPSKAELVLDAYTAKLSRLPPLLPSPDAFADLEDDLKRFFAIMRNDLIAKGMRGMIADAQLDPEFKARFYARIAYIRCEALHRVLDHGWEMGQFRRDFDSDALAHMIHGAFWYRLLSGTQESYDDAYARELVNLLRCGIATSRVDREPRNEIA